MATQLVMPTDKEVVKYGYEDRGYQTIGTEFLKLVKRGWLTDDPGLGKTPQAIKATELPAMVVAPRYLCHQWSRAIRREHPDAVIAFADGTRKQRDKILNKRADWYIVNLEMLATYDMPTGVRTYINDESHHLRNRRATHSKAAFIMENDDPKSRIYNLTATPFWKTIDDIWMQAHILYPTVFTSYRDFVKMYCTTLRSPWGGPKVVGIKPRMRNDLKLLLKPVMLGRTYAEVGRYLPDIIESEIRIDLPPMQRAIYNKLMQEYSIKWLDDEERKKMIFTPTTVLHALRQVTARSGKFEAVKGIIEDNYDKPAMIGFWYRDHAQEMQRMLGDKISVFLSGHLDPTERNRQALWAQRNGMHIVATQDSLTEGIDLNHYRLFIFAEKHYVPGSNHQFLSRVVRDRNDNGRDTEPVRVFHVMVRNSIDVAIHRVASRRHQVNNAARELLELTFKGVA